MKNTAALKVRQERDFSSALLLIALLIVITAVYWAGAGGGFVFDDYPNIVFNTALHVTQLNWHDWASAALSSPASDLPRPIAMLSFAANHYFTGLNPVPMKLTNVGIHLLNTVLVFGVARSLLEAVEQPPAVFTRVRIALFIAACWSLMPINLMAILLVVQRMEILCHSFVFAGLWMYLAGRLRQQRNLPGWSLILAGIVFGTGLGLLSKESAVLLPLYAVAIELCVFRFRGPGGGRNNRLIAMFSGVIVLPAALGLSWLLPRVLNPVAFASRNFTLLQRLMTEPRIVLDYLHWTTFPNLGQLSLFHDDYIVSTGLLSPPTTLLSLIGVLGLGLLAWWIRRSRPLLGLGLFWFLLAQLLTATVIPLELVFEHRNYFASLGVSLALTDLIFFTAIANPWRSVRTLLAAGLIIFYATSTHLRALEWSNPLRFALTEAEKHPQSPRATYHLAQAYAIMSGGQADSPFTPAAFAAFDRARLVPGANISPSQGALLLAVRTGSPLKDEWWDDIRTRLRNQPIGSQETSALGALTSCATFGRCRFPAQQMVATFAAALSQGDHPEILNIYADYAVNVLKDPELAERLWREAHRLNPSEAQYVISMAKLMVAVGRYQDASEEIRRLRAMGRLGQYAGVADSLEARLAGARDQEEQAQ